MVFAAERQFLATREHPSIAACLVRCHVANAERCRADTLRSLHDAVALQIELPATAHDLLTGASTPTMPD